MKITGAHDFNDYGAAMRHKLPPIVIFTLDAKINENGAEAVTRAWTATSRARRWSRSSSARASWSAPTPHKMMVPQSGRTGVVVEPMLTDQWFVKMEGMATRGLEAVKRGEVRFFPEHWTATYNHWLENIQDWCISRQLWWGHQIPAWYDDAGKIYVARTEEEAPEESRRQDR